MRLSLTFWSRRSIEVRRPIWSAELSDGENKFPLALVFLNTEKGQLYVDTAIFNADDLSVLFSFTRNHFMVDAPLPYQYSHFLEKAYAAKVRL